MQKQCIKICVVLVTVTLVHSLLFASTSSFQNQATFLQHTDNGLYVVHQKGLPYTNGISALDDPLVVWSHNLIDAIYNTTSNTIDGHVFAGTWLNPPLEAQLFTLTGGGTPEWGYSGTEFFTDAGDAAFTLAAVDEDAAGLNVIKWTGPGDGTPDWDTSFAGYGVSSYGPIAVSDDGSTIAAVASPPGTDAHLLLFDADSSVCLANYEATGLGFPRYVKINADGRYTAFIASATLVIYDRDSLDVRAQIPMGASNSALDISGDGDVIAYGWTSMVVRQWDGSMYQTLWSWNTSGYYVTRIAISTDGSTIVSCWYTTTFTTLKIVVHDISSSTPLWTYDYPTSSGAYQESANDVDITDDGAYFIVGSLGDAANINPEVHIFQRDSTPYIYYTVDMPGSMFSVDITSDGSYATACGKHVHANQMGRGGDIILIETGIIGIHSDDFTRSPEKFMLDIQPNPFSKRTVIRCEMRDESEQKLKIYDVTGALVKQWNHPTIQQSNCVSWSGTDQADRQLSAGVYFVQLETSSRTIAKKAVLLR
ncbi:hypothetical protein AMJ87_12195 [candidate division WOR_3 bacterium SM23_60]|uniref:Secretion system C-terminal sorting domain-containing protein n=1 Tax=candidate division WOR_3 bacterium SM23_60 TaxID=1703780 RepID=A0A0S8G5N1_UNCW3|nr:MAG: hypothetical protein AMJ87_12195 [candidate division WOR_3 bacterium SM23_60]